MEKPLRILLVDDRDDLREEIALWLNESLGHSVAEADGFQSALEIFDQKVGRFDVALVDYGLKPGEGNGLDLLRKLHQREANFPVIVFTGRGDRKISQEVLQEKAFWYLEKPLDLVETKHLLSWARRYRITAERFAQYGGLAEASPWAIKLFQAIAAAKTAEQLQAAIQEQAHQFLGVKESGLFFVDLETDEIRDPPGLSREGAVSTETLKSRALTLTAPSASDFFFEEDDRGPWALAPCPFEPEQGSSAILYTLLQGPLQEEQRLILKARMVALARLVGAAFERARQMGLLDTLVTASKELLEAKTEEEIFRIAARQLQERFKIPGFYLSLYDRATQEIRCKMFFSRGRDITGEVPLFKLTDLPLDLGWTAEVIRTDKELEIPDGEDPEVKVKPIRILEDSPMRSYFGVPLRHGDGKLMGVLSLQSTKPRRFPESSQHAFRTLANLISPAIGRVQISQAEKRRQDAEHRIGGLMDRNTLAKVIPEILSGVWPGSAVRASLLLADRGSRQLHFADQKDRTPILFGEGLAGRVAETGETLPRQGSDLEGLSLFHPDSASALCVPIQLGDSLLGVLNAESPVRDFFDGEDRLFLESIAASIASNLAAAGRKDIARAIFDAASQAARNPESGLQSLSQSIHEIASKAGSAPTSTTIFILTGDTLELASAWPEHLTSELKEKVGKLPFKPAEGLKRGYVAAAAAGATQFITDVSLEAADTKYIPFDGKTRAELAIPVHDIDQQRVIGVLNLEYENPKALNEEDRSFVEALADQAAIITILQRQAQELTAQQRDEAERQADEAMISRDSARHAQKQAIAGALTNVGIGRKLTDELKDANDAAEIQRIKEGLSTCFEAIHRRLDELEILQKGHLEEKAHFALKPWLSKLVAERALTANGVDFEVQDRLSPADMVFADSHILSFALNNLIDNAIRAAKEAAARPVVTVRAWRESDRLLIEVSDNGPGIDEKVQPYLFTSRVPLHLIHPGGNGRGCRLASTIIRKYRGQISLAPMSAAQKGTTVKVELPISMPIVSAKEHEDENNPSRR